MYKKFQETKQEFIDMLMSSNFDIDDIYSITKPYSDNNIDSYKELETWSINFFENEIIGRKFAYELAQSQIITKRKRTELIKIILELI